MSKRVAVTASVFAGVFHLIIPIGLMLAMSVLLSFLSVMDPLHAKKHVESIWFSLAEIVVVQAVIFIATIVGVTMIVRFLAGKLRGAMLYLAVGGLSLGLHFAVLAVLAVAAYVIGLSEPTTANISFYFFYSIVIGPLMGLISAAIGNRPQTSEQMT